MQTTESISRTLAAYKQNLSIRYGVKELAIFGSFSRGDNTNESDVDILVEFDKPIGIQFVDLANELERILKVKVDLVSRNAIKPKYFSQIKNELKYV
jgi:predicted nucleotidyltransferase